eukprot:403337383
MKNLQSLDQLTVICEFHKPEIAAMYCFNCELPVCRECKFDTHRDHQLVELKQTKFKTYSANVLSLFDEYSVQNVKQQITKQGSNEIQLTSTEFKSMISKIHRMLNHLASEDETSKIDFISCLGDPQNIPQNRRVNVNQSEQIQAQNSSAFNEKEVLKLINESQALLREEFKRDLDAFENSQGQKDKIINDQLDMKINDIQRSITEQLQQLKQEINTDLNVRFQEYIDHNKQFNESLKAINQNYNQLNQQIQQINDNCKNELKLLTDQLNEFSCNIDEIKLFTKKQINEQANQLLEFQQVLQEQGKKNDTLDSEYNQNEINYKINNLHADLTIVSSLVYNNLETYKNEQQATKYQMQSLFKHLVDQEINQTNQSLLKSQFKSIFKDSFDKKFELLFQGTKDGFTASKFHELCDEKGQTVFFILSECGQVFGGFTSVPWTSPDHFLPYSDPSAFVFSLSKRSIHKQYRNQHQEVWHDKDYMCVFGGGEYSDIDVRDNCDQKSNCWCNLGFTYEPPNGYQYESNESQSYLAGQYEFRVLEIQVYQLYDIYAELDLLFQLDN